MTSASPLHLLRSLTTVLARPAAAGRCYRCERFSAWTARDGFYRCTHCGADPVHDRPADTDAPTQQAA